MSRRQRRGSLGRTTEPTEVHGSDEPETQPEVHIEHGRMLSGKSSKITRFILHVPVNDTEGGTIVVVPGQVLSTIKTDFNCLVGLLFSMDILSSFYLPLDHQFPFP